MQIKKCQRCGQVKNWQGDDIKCPFQNSDEFGDNWRCGIIRKIRELCHIAESGDDPRLHYQYCEDQKFVTINTNELEDVGLCLWITWYKSRGRTEAMWLLDEYNPPRKPTYEELEAIIEHYSNSEK